MHEDSKEDLFMQLIGIAVNLGWNVIAYEKGGDETDVRGVVFGTEDFVNNIETINSAAWHVLTQNNQVQ